MGQSQSQDESRDEQYYDGSRESRRFRLFGWLYGDATNRSDSGGSVFETLTMLTTTLFPVIMNFPG